VIEHRSLRRCIRPQSSPAQPRRRNLSGVDPITGAPLDCRRRFRHLVRVSAATMEASARRAAWATARLSCLGARRTRAHPDEVESGCALASLIAHVLFGKPVPTHSASKTRVNALMVKSGAGFFRDMR
jgi:hypothetical protein